MIDTNKLRGAIRAKGYTLAEAAKIIGISESSMQRKLKIGIFGSDEIEKMIDAYDIREPKEVFFVQKVTFKDTKA